MWRVPCLAPEEVHVTEIQIVTVAVLFIMHFRQSLVLLEKCEVTLLFCALMMM